MPIPANIKEKYDEIAALLTVFCDEKLNDEYKELCLLLLKKLSRKRPSPISGGRPGTWAAGIVYAIGSNNFIFDKSQKLHMTSVEIASAFGVSSGTASGKGNEIKKMFDISYFNPEWQLVEFLENNPVIWMVMVNGIVVDIRKMPMEVKEQAFEMGIIPYIPESEDTYENIFKKNDDEKSAIINQPKPVKKREEIKEQLNFGFDSQTTSR